jgi:branched-chain amino acid transport system substrate-binding protein
MKGKFLFISILIVIVASLVLIGCQAPPPSTPPTTAPPTTTAPPAAAGVIKIGHIRPLTGHMAISGTRMIKGFQVAIDDAGGMVAGKKIEVLTEDDAADANKSIDKARKLVEQDKVAIIIGPTVGGTQMAVASYLEKVGIPCMHTNPSPLGVIMQHFQWTIQAAGAEPQEPSVQAKYAYEQAGVKTITCITADWAPGHGFMDSFIGTFKKLGGQVIQEQYPPVASADFAPYLATMKDADACVAWFDGTDAVKFLSQYQEFGLWKRMPIVPAFHGSFFSPFLIDQLPPAAAAPIFGRFGPTPYLAQIDNPTNKRFLEICKTKLNTVPDENESGPYSGALMLLAALKATNGDTTPAKLKQAILDLNIEVPDGPVKFDKEKMSAIRNIYIGKFEKVGSQTVQTPLFTYKEVPATGF